MMIICFFPPKIYAEGIRLVGNIIISHHCFVTKVHSLHGVGANFVLFQLHGTHSWTWKQVRIAANQMQFHPTLILLSRGSVNTPKVFISRFDCFSWGPDSIVCSSVYMHCMIDLDCYKVMCWKAVWWDLGMSFSLCDTGDMRLLTGEYGTSGNRLFICFLLYYHFLQTPVVLAWRDHNDPWKYLFGAKSCSALPNYLSNCILVQKFKNLNLLKNCKNHLKEKRKRKRKNCMNMQKST